MIKLAKFAKGVNMQTLAIGVGVTVLAPVVMSLASGTLRPLARSMVKTGLQVGNKVKEATAEARESFDDMVAEVQDEISNEHMSTGEEVATCENSVIEGEAVEG